MRVLITSVLFFFSLIATADHVVGGEISWKFNTQGEAVFSFAFYQICGGIPPPTSISLDGPQGTILCNLSQTKQIQYYCDAQAPNACNLNDAFVKYIYQSAPQNLSGVIPPTGWVYSFSFSGYSQVINVIWSNTYTEAVMYQKVSSPIRKNDGIATVLFGALQVFDAGLEGNSLIDSIYYEFAPLKKSANANMTFKPNFSQQSPFPNPISNPNNGNIDIRFNTGMIRVRAQSGSSGMYAFAVKAVAYSQGNISSIQYLNSYLKYRPLPNTDFKPLIFNSLDSNTSGFYKYIDTAIFYGDSLTFDLITTDATPGSKITLDTTSEIFRTNAGSSAAKINFLYGQSGLVSYDTNAIHFSWKPKENDFKARPYKVLFTFDDDHCPDRNLARWQMMINLKKALFIPVDTLESCGSITLSDSNYTPSGKYHWSPDSIVSNDTIKSPYIFASVSQYLYLTDPENPGQKDSVWIDVKEKKAFYISGNPQGMFLVDSNNATNIKWYLNGLPYVNNVNATTAFADGAYHVEADAGSCHLISDTLVLLNGNIVNNIEMGNGEPNKEPISLNQSYGFQFDAPYPGVRLNFGVLYGLTDSTETSDTLTMKVYDAQKTELSTVKGVVNGSLVHFALDSAITLVGNDFVVAFSSDSLSPKKIMAYQNVTYPYAKESINIDGAVQGNVGVYPENSSDILVPAYLSFTGLVSLNEDVPNVISIYPNPANDYFIIKSETNIELEEILFTDISGRRADVKMMKDNNRIRVSTKDLKKGIYLLKVGADGFKILVQ